MADTGKRIRHVVQERINNNIVPLQFEVFYGVRVLYQIIYVCCCRRLTLQNYAARERYLLYSYRTSLVCSVSASHSFGRQNFCFWYGPKMNIEISDDRHQIMDIDYNINQYQLKLVILGLGMRLFCSIQCRYQINTKLYHFWCKF